MMSAPENMTELFNKFTCKNIWCSTSNLNKHAANLPSLLLDVKNDDFRNLGGIRSVNPVQLPLRWYCILTVVSSPTNPQNRRWKSRHVLSVLCSNCSGNSFDVCCRWKRNTQRQLFHRKKGKKKSLNWIHFQKTKHKSLLGELELATGTCQKPKLKPSFLLQSARLSNGENHETKKKRTLFPACPQTLLMRLKAVGVSSAAAVPEARAASGGSIIVPIEDKFGTGSFLFGKLADVHSCGERWEEEKKQKKRL